MDYENWRPKGWANIPFSQANEFGAQCLLDAIIARMKKMGMAVDLFFEDEVIE